MTTDHYDPHGQALLDYFNGDTSATIVYVDPETLAKHAGKAGYRCEVIEEGDNHRYLARLTLL